MSRRIKILLDFSGVLITPSVGQSVEQPDDGFIAFNPACAANLVRILQHTLAEIVLTTTYRTRYDVEKWQALFHQRGIDVGKISKVNQASRLSGLKDRCTEIMQWIADNPNADFVIIDDAQSLHNLPPAYQDRWVETNFLTGLDDEKTNEVLQIIKRGMPKDK